MKITISTLCITLIVSCTSFKPQSISSIQPALNIIPQNIITVTQKYVVIKIDNMVQETLNSAQVLRFINNKRLTVGKVQFLKYHNGRAVAKILKENSKTSIIVGDYVVMKYKQVNEMNVGEFISQLRYE